MRTWGDGYGYFLVASGRAEAMVDPVCSVWDLAPVPIIIEEAGGKFSNLLGEPGLKLDQRSDRLDGLATNGLLHNEVLATLGKS
jgi:fructose-1,6-bisphosphatase/inositol monophosphatase family enzyme